MRCADSWSVRPPVSDLAYSSDMRSRVRSMRLVVLIASTLEAFVSNAGATMNVTTAKGL